VPKGSAGPQLQLRDRLEKKFFSSLLGTKQKKNIDTSEKLVFVCTSTGRNTVGIQHCRGTYKKTDG
jgi:hypothetical protein